MHQVVQRLRTEKSEALIELREFRGALNEIQGHIESLVRSTQVLERATQLLVVPESDLGGTQVRALQDGTAKVNEMASLLLAAYGELCFGVQGWDIEGENRASN